MLNNNQTNKFLDRLNYWIDALTNKDDVINSINSRKSFLKIFNGDFIATKLIEDDETYESFKLTINLEDLKITKVFISYNPTMTFNVYNSTGIMLYNLENIDSISNSEILLQSLKQLKMRYYRSQLANTTIEDIGTINYVHIPYDLEDVNIIYERELSFVDKNNIQIAWSYEDIVKLIHSRSDELTKSNKETFYKLLDEKRLHKMRSRTPITL